MKHSLNFFFTFLKVDLLTFCRNRTAAFWTFAFPLLLLIIFMGSFGGSVGLAKVSIRVVDLDNTKVSKDFVSHLRFVFDQQKSVKVLFDSEAEEKLVLTIPSDFGRRLDSKQGAAINLEASAESGLASQITEKILASVADDFVLRQLYEFRGISLISNVVTTNSDSTKKRELSNENYPAYLVTGLLCMVVVSTSLMGFVMPLVNSRQNGNFRVFELIPASRFSIVSALAVSKFIVILLSGVLLFVFGILFYRLGLTFEIQRFFYGFLVLVIGVLGFLCLALVIAARVMTTDWANIICNLIYFPLILLGNLFIPIESHNVLSKFLDHMPVNLFVKALRGTLIGGESIVAFSNFLAIFGFLIVGSLFYASRAFVLNKGVE